MSKPVSTDGVTVTTDGVAWSAHGVWGRATGGTVTDVGGWRYHTFTEDDDFVVTSPGHFEYLIVAGGGGGDSGGSGGGGGGAGGLLSDSVSFSGGIYPVVIGQGGVSGAPGGDTSLGDLIAVGGGEGARSDRDGGDGGSGGGGGGSNAGTPGIGGSGTAGQGHDGGKGVTGSSAANNAGGGGGGAGESGGDAVGGSSGVGGRGGDGIEFPQFASWGAAGWFAAGGGGGSRDAGTGDGGLGGGGDGGSGTGETGSGTPGQDGTGSGGGGGGYSDATGGDGGDGIVIIRYQSPYHSEVLADNPSHYWRLDDSTVVDDITETAATVSGATQDSEGPGDLTGSYSFDGTDQIDTNLTFRPGAASYTVEVWGKFTTSKIQRIIADRSGPNGVGLGADGTDALFSVYGEYDFTAGSLTADTWHHVVVTVEGGGTTRLYVDATQVGSRASSDTNTSTTTVRLGVDPHGPAQWWEGLISRVAIYPTELSAARIQAHYDEVFPSVGPFVRTGTGILRTTSGIIRPAPA